MLIRFAKKDELERVNKLRKEVFEIHANGRPDIFRPEFSKELQDEIYALYEKDDHHIIVAIKDDEIYGFAIFNYVEKPQSPYTHSRKYCHLSELSVDSRFRHQKVATKLVRFIKNEAHQNHIDQIQLMVWDFNESALKLYESLGFSPFSRYMEFHSDSSTTNL